MIVILIAFGAADIVKIVNGDIKSITKTENQFDFESQTIDLNEMKDFNFGFGTVEPVPATMGKFFAEFVTQTRADDSSDPKKTSIPLKLYPCKES